MMQCYEDILEAAKGTKPRRLVTAFGEPDLDLICRATAAGFIIPCLIGDGKAIETLIERSPLASLEHEIVDEKDPGRTLHRAISLIRGKRADILMQGSFDQNTFVNAVLDVGTGLLKDKAASYVSLFELPGHGGKLILVTDTYLNNCPDLTGKQRILENALSLSAILGIDTPKVAVLAAIEQVNPGIPSTLDAAILSKMSERGQFGKALVEGPLDIDCSLSNAAARRKEIQSPVTGNVDIYVVPEIDTGHLLAEVLVCIGRIRTAGMVMGTTCPVILDVPFVPDECRLVEIALASLALSKGEEDG
jgi:phosphate butyryltransferase